MTPTPRRKTQPDQALARRQPQQARSQQKVELILEAAIRILDAEGEHALTTNRVAAVAGVSIGTLYQYFHDKQAILDALAQRELEAIAVRVMASLTGPPPDAPGGRVRAVVQATLGAFGGRTRVQRWLIHGALGGGVRSPFSGLHGVVLDLLTSTGIVAHDRHKHTLTPAEAFVLTQSISGVVRGMLADGEDLPPRAEVEDALVRLVTFFARKETPTAEAPPRAAPGR